MAVAMAQRVTLRKRNPYNTTSNRRRIVKTPGGKLVYHHIKKLATAPKCGDCGIALPGVRLPPPTRPCLCPIFLSITSRFVNHAYADVVLQIPALRPRQYATISKRQKSVNRAYGGSRCGDCVKQRYVTPFSLSVHLV